MSLSILALILVIVSLVCAIAAGVMGRVSQPTLLLAVAVVLLAVVHLLGAGPLLIR